MAVVQRITDQLPHRYLNRKQLPRLDQYHLADPEFHIPATIDLLIGADMYFGLTTGRQYQLSNGPHIIETKLGWVISGPVRSQSTNINQVCLFTQQHDLTSILRKFWEIEEIDVKPPQSQDDQIAEQLFTTHHYRTAEGRYVVPMLFRDYPPTFGKTYGTALACYRSLRKRLQADSNLCQHYTEFMEDYLNSGHMIRCKYTLASMMEGFFIPHHCVLKPESTTTKLRVVFNGSKQSSNGVSLNAALLPGPALQNDLSKIILRLRFHQIMFTTDIRQMYRQFRIVPDQCKYKKILWTFDLADQPLIFELQTITYGTSSAPYLALRTLLQLVQDEGTNYPEAAKALTDDTFVDDIITGANTLAAAFELRDQLIALLAKAGLELRKWSSNCPELLSDLPQSHLQLQPAYNLDPDSTVKILGLMCNPTTDNFQYQINLPDTTNSKRQLLSEAARIFDPLGWLSPITIIAKQLIQILWKSGLDWDEPLPTTITDRWQEFKSQLHCLSSLMIPRWIPTYANVVDLIGCCDASEKNYAAVIFFRTESHSQVTVSLVIAKTKVAPVKQISLPRLELCAAALLAQLSNYVVRNLPVEIRNTFLFTDSTVTLAWIQSASQTWKTFVANRVGQIQNLTKVQDWHHIKSQDNPADCASRGIFPADLPNHALWWHGVRWFASPIAEWPLDNQNDRVSINVDIQKESKPPTCLLNQEQQHESIADRYSSLNTLLRVTAYCRRFSNNCRHPLEKQTRYLTASSLESALSHWISVAQRESFADDLDRLRNNRMCTNHIQKLCPFLDDAGILRVGGRLKNGNIPYDSKHPILLPASHRITELIIQQYHQRYLHPSPRTLQSILSQRYWIISTRRLARRISAKCVTCFRCKPTNEMPMMGDLPEWRVKPLKPFSAVGVDYGGPFLVTPYKGRGFKTSKAYICLFICFSTRAVHLELASDLSTEVFLGAFRRFLARRGRCSRIFSDSGTNFIGAKRYFTELQRFVNSTDHNKFLTNHLAADGIEWDLNPPSGPHFGGLWEAAIKSVKFHLARTIGSTTLTYEEFCTVLCQIESILNSRPLGAFSNDPNDLRPLTPNHILTLEAAVNLPEQNLRELPDNHLSRWQLVQKIVLDFWKRWHNEYLNTLQCRTKWRTPTKSVEVGSLVLIKDDSLPPLQWRLGRVNRVFTGKDNTVRVAELKTATTTITRPVVKLYPLPT